MGVGFAGGEERLAAGTYYAQGGGRGIHEEQLALLRCGQEGAVVLLDAADAVGIAILELDVVQEEVLVVFGRVALESVEGCARLLGQHIHFVGGNAALFVHSGHFFKVEHEAVVHRRAVIAEGDEHTLEELAVRREGGEDEGIDAAFLYLQGRRNEPVVGCLGVVVGIECAVRILVVGPGVAIVVGIDDGVVVVEITKAFEHAAVGRLERIADDDHIAGGVLDGFAVVAGIDTVGIAAELAGQRFGEGCFGEARSHDFVAREAHDGVGQFRGIVNAAIDTCGRCFPCHGGLSAFGGEHYVLRCCGEVVADEELALNGRACAGCVAHYYGERVETLGGFDGLVDDFAGLAVAAKLDGLIAAGLCYFIVYGACERLAVVTLLGEGKGDDALGGTFAGRREGEVDNAGGRLHHRLLEIGTADGVNISGPSAKCGYGIGRVEFVDGSVLAAECEARTAAHPVELARAVVAEQRLAVLHIIYIVLGHKVGALDEAHFGELAFGGLNAAEVDALVARHVVLLQVDGVEVALVVAADGQEAFVGVHLVADAAHLAVGRVDFNEPGVGVVLHEAIDFVGRRIVGHRDGRVLAVALEVVLRDDFQRLCVKNLPYGNGLLVVARGDVFVGIDATLVINDATGKFSGEVGLALQLRLVLLGLIEVVDAVGGKGIFVDKRVGEGGVEFHALGRETLVVGNLVGKARIERVERHHINGSRPDGQGLLACFRGAALHHLQFDIADGQLILDLRGVETKIIFAVSIDLKLRSLEGAIAILLELLLLGKHLRMAGRVLCRT